MRESERSREIESETDSRRKTGEKLPVEEKKKKEEEEEEGTTVEKLKSFWVCNFRARGTFLLYWFIYFNNE